jgi:hypothetical protein
VTVSVRDLMPWAFYGLSAVVLIWDIVLAGQISQLRHAPRSFRAMTALSGLLIAPAAFIAVTAVTILNGRAIYVLAWVWPATLLLFAVQASYATLKGLVSPFIGVPIAIYDVLAFVVAMIRWSAFAGYEPPGALFALVASQANALGIVLGKLPLYSPLAVQLPLLAPAYPARWRLSATMRGSLALSAAVAVVLTVVEIPRSYNAVRSYEIFGRDRLQERSGRSLMIGLRLFPGLRSGPPPLALRDDMALLDSVGVGAVSVVIDPEGTRGTTLDSLARSLDELRADSVLIIASLGYPRAAGVAFRRSPRAYMQERLADIDRIARRLRPDYLLPVVDPYAEGTRRFGYVSPAWWEQYLRLAARTAHRASGRIRVAVSVSSFTRDDSTLYAWAVGRDSPLDAVGFSLYPSYGGGASMAARTRIADRWMRGARMEHWVFATGGYPMTHGEPSQARAIWGALAWATSRPNISGAIIDGAGDYDRLTGLRASSGRLRPALAAVGRAVNALAETAQ